jgi:hypothetical protein
MIASLAGNILAMSCLGCAPQAADADVIRIDLGPVSRPGAEFREDQYEPVFPTLSGGEFRLPLKVGNDFSPSNWASNENAGRFNAIDLSIPMPVRTMAGEQWSAEVSFGASAEQTGLGFDVEIAPRAQFQQNRAGADVSRTGAEVRFGQNLDDRDQRGTNAAAPAWYFFIGADNEALVWNVADEQSMSGLVLRDQATVGDLQLGIARSMAGGQMSLGMVERKLRFHDQTGENDVREDERFVAFSYTLKN